ncbi:zinc finger protein 792-like isoform X2 [Pararge aegeria]|uniref:zinc finger protein 792-like isoform X2 n=1 Tax=Pararge aegeria TaxID=116150 RepID=UPI0019D1510A|nr:zinc finger protein 792-like isoform X2 [Pararge aegeria]XP_039754078.1 zinc finger protein 792-like isoform X2 [Pararge aegeria]
MYGYYFYIYPSLFVSGMVGLDTLEQRLRKACLLLLNNKVDNPDTLRKCSLAVRVPVKTIRQNDGKPQYICVECVQTLCKAVELKQVAEVTQWRLAQEAEMVSESASNDYVDDCNNHDDEEIVIENLDAPKCEECRKTRDVNNDCKLCKENVKKPRCGRGPYICESCGLKLKTMWRLKTHMLVHTNEFNYSCGYCPYRSRSRSSLQIHERTHTGDRPYQCVQCHATFSSASNLASHRRSHLPPVFSCDVCQRGFKFKQSLLNHIATQHRSAKPFCCCQCESSFATRKMLFCHERKIHGRPRMRQGATPSYIKLQENFGEVSQEES